MAAQFMAEICYRGMSLVVLRRWHRERPTKCIAQIRGLQKGLYLWITNESTNCCDLPFAPHRIKVNFWFSHSLSLAWRLDIKK